MMFRVLKAQSGARVAGRPERFIFGDLELWGRKACLGPGMGLSPGSEGRLQSGALGGARRRRRTQRSFCEAFGG